MKKKITILILCLSILCTQFLNAGEIFLSLKKNKVNVRYGPSFDSEIKYIYKKMNLPVKQIDQKENFRRIMDLKNNNGWIHVSQLKKINSVITLNDKILFRKASSFSRPITRLESGRLLVIKDCENDWCNVTTGKYTGWVKNEKFWGSTK